LVCPASAEIRGERAAKGRRQWCEDAQHRQHGPSVLWDEQSRRRVEAHFEHGSMHGAYQSWHENGQLALSGATRATSAKGVGRPGTSMARARAARKYRGGQQNGVAKEWYPNGQLRFEEHYVDGERNGPAVAYYENGQKQSEGSFARGAFDGTWTGWYEDGAKQKVATYQRGTKTGEQEFPRASD
jgi:antitoxin component YwqK of YwqJK toxin-antitoxin module